MTEGPKQYFTKEIQVTIKDKSNCSDESHRNTDLQNLRSLIGFAKFKISDRIQRWRIHVDALTGTLMHADGMGTWAQSLWKTTWQFCEVTLHHAIPLVGMSQIETLTGWKPGDTSRNVHSIPCNDQKESGKSQISIIQRNGSIRCRVTHQLTVRAGTTEFTAATHTMDEYVEDKPENSKSQKTR